jgi:hypothetical protein
MADVKVEFGATDTGLEETLKNVREAMSKLEEKQKSTAMGVDEFSKSMQEIRKLQGQEKYLIDLAGGAEKLGKSATGAEKPVKELTQEFAKLPTPLQNAETRLKGIQTELGELREKAAKAEMTTEEFEATLKKIGQLESAEKKLKAIGGEAKDLGQESDKAEKTVDELGTEIKEAGDQAHTATAKVDKLANEEKQAGAAAKEMGDKSKWGFGEIAVGAAIAGAAAKAGMMVMDAAFAGVRKTIEGFAQALDMGGRLTDLSERTGMAADELLIFERAFQNAGLEAGDFGTIINKMQDSLVGAREGSGAAADALTKLGISMSDLDGMTQAEQFKFIAKAISQIEDPALRTSLSMDIFGRAGGKLNQLFGDMEGAVAEAKEELGSLPQIMAQYAPTFDKVGDKLSSIGGKFVEFAAGIIQRVLPALESITVALARVDASKIGQQLADFFTKGGQSMVGFQQALDAINAGNMAKGIEIIFKSVEVMAKTAANQVYAAFVAAFETLAEFIVKMFSPSGALIETISKAFSMLGKEIAGSIQQSLADTFDKVLGMGMLSQAFQRMADESKSAAKVMSIELGGAGERIKAQLKEAGGAFPETFEEKFKKVPPLFKDIAQNQAEILKLSADQALAIDPQIDKLGRIGKLQEAIKAGIEAQAMSAEPIPSIQEAIKQAVEEINKIQKEVTGTTGETKKETEKVADAAGKAEGAIEGAAKATDGVKKGMEGAKDAAGDVTAELDKQKAAAEQAARAAAAKAEEERKAAKAKSGEFVEELSFLAQIERAKKDGNVPLERSLQNQKEYNSLLAEYIKYMPEEKAKQWAREIANVKAPLLSVTEQMDLIAKKKLEEPVLTFGEASEKVKDTLRGMADVLGNDFSKLSFPDLARAMNIDTFGKTSREVLLEIQRKLDQIKDSDIQLDMDDKLAKEKLEEFRTGIKPIKVGANTSDFEDAWDDIEMKFAKQYEIKGDTEKLKSDVEEFFEDPQILQVNTDPAQKKIESLEDTPIDVKPEINQPAWNQALRNMEAEVKVNAQGGDATANGGEGGEGGEGGLGGEGDDTDTDKPTGEEWKNHISSIRDAVVALKDKLPHAVLV